LLYYPDGTYARASEGFELQQADAGRFVGNNVLRYPRGLGHGYLIEGSKTNKCLHSEDLSDAVWSKPGGLVVTADQDTAPDEAAPTKSADQVDYVASGGSTTNQNITTFTDSVDVTVSVWARCASGTEQFRIRTKSKANNVAVSSAFTVTTTWQRFDFTFAVEAGATTPLIGLQNAADAAARSIFFWGVQAEESSFPTSYIRTTTAAVTRSADELNYADAPLRMRTGKWSFVFTPEWASDELVAPSRIELFSFANSGPQAVFLKPVGDGTIYIAVRDVAGEKAKVDNVTVARNEPTYVVVDNALGTLSITNESSGTLTDSSTAPTLDTGTLRVGYSPSANRELFGLITEPIAA
jgi:hypothetical protein